MSVRAEIRSTADVAAPAKGYDRILKAVHWSTLLLIAAAYIAIWESQNAASKE
jgi:cytochrome b561